MSDQREAVIAILSNCALRYVRGPQSEIDWAIETGTRLLAAHRAPRPVAENERARASVAAFKEQAARQEEAGCLTEPNGRISYSAEAHHHLLAEMEHLHNLSLPPSDSALRSPDGKERAVRLETGSGMKIQMSVQRYNQLVVLEQEKEWIRLELCDKHWEQVGTLPSEAGCPHCAVTAASVAAFKEQYRAYLLSVIEEANAHWKDVAARIRCDGAFPSICYEIGTSKLQEPPANVSAAPARHEGARL